MASTGPYLPILDDRLLESPGTHHNENLRSDAQSEAAADVALAACLGRIELACVRLEGFESRTAALQSPEPSTKSEAARSVLEAQLSGAPGAASVLEASSSTPPLSKRKRNPTPRKPGAGEGSDLASSSRASGIGLKEYSMMVCEKVLAKGTTTYNEVADDLVQDFVSGVVRGVPDGEIDEKNIRRRVYDALNVLEACGAISKSSKSIQWVGWPRGPPTSPSGNPVAEASPSEDATLAASSDPNEWNQKLKDIINKGNCLCNLALRNMRWPLHAVQVQQVSTTPVPSMLQLPFMLIQVAGEVEVRVANGDDPNTMHIDFHGIPPTREPYFLLDDQMVMQRMDLGTPRPDLVAVAARSSATFRAAVQAADPLLASLLLRQEGPGSGNPGRAGSPPPPPPPAVVGSNHAWMTGAEAGQSAVLGLGGEGPSTPGSRAHTPPLAAQHSTAALLGEETPRRGLGMQEASLQLTPLAMPSPGVLHMSSPRVGGGRPDYATLTGGGAGWGAATYATPAWDTAWPAADAGVEDAAAAWHQQRGLPKAEPAGPSMHAAASSPHAPPLEALDMDPLPQHLSYAVSWLYPGQRPLDPSLPGQQGGGMGGGQ